MPKDEKPPTRAAPRAGTISSVHVTGSIDPLTVATRTPNRPPRQRRQDPVDPGQHVGREAEDDGAVLVLGRRPGGQPEPGEAEHGPERDGDDDDEAGEDHLVLGMVIPPSSSTGAFGEERLHRAGRGSEAQDDDGLQHDEEADRRDDLGQGRGVEKRSEDEQVEQEPDERRENASESTSAGQNPIAPPRTPSGGREGRASRLR